MKIQRFNLYDDLHHINEWLVKHNHPKITRHDIPEQGYMAWNNGTPVACVFIRRCEGHIGIIDGLASNPVVQSHLRHVALDGLIEHALEQCKKAKFKYVMGHTMDEGTFNRSIRLGFKETPFRVVMHKFE